MMKLFTIWIALVFSLGLIASPILAQTITPINVTAEIPARAESFIFELKSSIGPEIHQNQDIEYTITYGSKLQTPTSISLEVVWEQGSSQILDFHPGDAEKAYGSTPAIVDPINHVISWNIANFPGNTTDTVHFHLVSNDHYQGQNRIPFYVTSHLVGAKTANLPDLTLNSTYIYKVDAPSTSSTTAASPSPLPSTSPSTPFGFTGLDIRQLSQSEAQIAISATEAITATVSFGTSAQNLSLSVSDTSLSKFHQLALGNLSPNTVYFFQVKAKNAQGKLLSSEVNTFKTALISESATVDPQSITISNGSNIISAPPEASKSASPQRSSVLVPKATPYDFKFKLHNFTNVRQVQALVRNQQVLGINTFTTNDPSPLAVDLLEIEPGVYYGKLKAPAIPGSYEIISRVTDDKGNIKEEKLFDVHSVKPLTIFDSSTQGPLENARVLLRRLNTRTNEYQILPGPALSIPNPSYSTTKGELDWILPPGSYKAEITGIGFEDQTVNFVIDPHQSMDLPQVSLQRGPFSIGNVLKYYLNIIQDSTHLTLLYIDSLASSLRFFNFISTVIILLLVIFSLLSLSFRTHIPLYALPKYVIFHTLALVSKRFRQQHIIGEVLDEESLAPISRADIYLVDPKTSTVLLDLKTDKSGLFYHQNISEQFKIIVMHSGYQTSPLVSYSHNLEAQNFRIFLKRSLLSTHSRFAQIPYILEAFIGFLFEMLLCLSLLFEIFFTYYLGWGRTLPFIALSIFNVFVWIIYLRNVAVRRQ